MNNEKSTKADGFDLVVTHRDPKTGQVVRSNPYILRVVGGSDGNRTRHFERPVGSGNLWNKNGEPVGRWEMIPGEKDKMGNPVFGQVNKPHVEFTPPLTTDQQLAKEVVKKDSRIAELERELAAIQADEKKTETKKPQAATKVQTAG